MYDVAIIGKGPAGISAAINSYARGKKAIIFGGDSKKVLLSPIIDNYPALPGITGVNFMEALNNHLSKTDVVISDKSVLTIYAMGESFTIQAQDEMIQAKKVILATGVNFKKTIENEDKFLGLGVSYCATCDAPLYRNKTVCVVGYNDEAVTDANFLSTLCEKVYFVPMTNVKDKSFNDNIEIITGVPKSFEGNMKADKLNLKDSSIECDGYFIIKDSYPLSSLVPGLELDGPHVKVNKNMETNIKGLFASGDITGKPYQLAKAVGEGQIAALYEHES
ncbi:NAD(P)/FAD-dependent oxidoreductase [Clostridium cylindrosporum]|uniref:Thioredoxin reductase n=1 Tax=Clostridium cylindrosporum DSM 605 TaxID=1121307 RepID=A0A0J8DB49_CLOCY|nr:NAD(P)/FAD-dependent oxidoreductase [Clostridium cylindrosporum]KMT23305.1 thioredoxin reductase [Clostridium cylindrosporum DSM 605]